MLARFTGGWGVLGGMAVLPGAGITEAPLSSHPVAYAGPRIFAGTAIEVSPGVAVDAAGNVLALCAPLVADIAALAARDPTAPQTKTCAQWFGIEGGNEACEEAQENITAREYWLVAEHQEALTRPAPKYSGSGPCDPSPTCDFSRALEDVRLRVVRELPEFYPVTGCLEDAAENLDTDLPAGSAGIVKLSTFLNGALSFQSGEGTASQKYASFMEYLDPALSRCFPS